MFTRMLVSRVLCLALCFVCFLAAAPPAFGARPRAKSIDVSKLNEGDAVEVVWLGEWVPGKVLKVEANRFVHVSTSAFPRGSAYMADRIRRPSASAKAAAAPPAENPFATEEEKADDREVRTWTDASGKFTTKAKLVRIEGEKIVLRREDGKEITVTLSKFTEADKRYVAAIQAQSEPSADAKAPATSASPATKAATEPESPPVAITPTDLNQAESIDTAEEVDWKYKPDAGEPSSGIKSARITLNPPTSIFEEPYRILLLPSEQEAFVVYRDHSPGKKQVTCRIQACDLKSRKVKSIGTFDPGVVPFDLAPDGSYLVARAEGSHSAGSAELRLYSRKGDKATVEAAWLPFAPATPGVVTDEKAAARPKLDRTADVEWGSFAGSERFLTINWLGHLVCWELPALKPLYQVKLMPGVVPALSANSKYLAVPSMAGIVILQAADGQAVGKLPAEITPSSAHCLAFSPSGKQIALWEGHRLRTWDLASQKQLQDFPVAAMHSSTEMAWAGEDHVLVGATLYNVPKRLPVWNYRSLKDWVARDGVFWFVVGSRMPRSTTGTMLASAVMPPKAALDAERSIKDEEALAIEPGMEVSIELPPGSDDKVRSSIVERLENQGLKVVPQSKIRLVGAIQAGKTVQIQYKAFGPRRGAPQQGAPQSATEQVLSLSWLVDGQPVWNYETHTAPPMVMHLEKGQTVDQQLQKQMQLDPSMFSRIWIPVHVPKPRPELLKLASDTPAG